MFVARFQNYVWENDFPTIILKNFWMFEYLLILKSKVFGEYVISVKIKEWILNREIHCLNWFSVVYKIYLKKKKKSGVHNEVVKNWRSSKLHS